MPPHFRNCEIDFPAHVELTPKDTCFAHDILILTPVLQWHCQARFDVTLGRIPMKIHVYEHGCHHVDATFWRIGRHDVAVLHLLDELCGFMRDVVALHVLVEVCVACLQDGGDAPAKYDHDVTPLPTQVKHGLRFLRGEVMRVEIAELIARMELLHEWMKHVCDTFEARVRVISSLGVAATISSRLVNGHAAPPAKRKLNDLLRNCGKIY